MFSVDFHKLFYLRKNMKMLIWFNFSSFDIVDYFCSLGRVNIAPQMARKYINVNINKQIPALRYQYPGDFGNEVRI